MKKMINMNRIYLRIYNTEKGFEFTKFFETLKEKENYKRRIKFIKTLFIIEDSSDIIFS